MEHVEETVEVAVPVRTAYNQWTQFESFPQFMSGVESVTQLTTPPTIGLSRWWCAAGIRYRNR